MYRAAFYKIKPGDTSSKLARELGGARDSFSQQRWIKDLMFLNGHIKDPNRINAGNVIALPILFNGRLPEIYPTDLAALQRAVQVPEQTFEPFKYLGDVFAEIGEKVGRGTLKVLNNSSYDAIKDVIGAGVQTLGNLKGAFAAQAPYLADIQRRATVEIERIVAEITRVRGNTIEFLNQTRTSVRTQEVFVVTVRSNGLYAFSQKAIHTLEFLERYKISNKLFVLDIFTETAKVAQTYVDTGSASAAAKQLSGSTVKILANLGMTAVTGSACVTLAPLGPPGWIGCGGLVITGVFTSQAAGEALGKWGYDKISEKIIQELR
jgi:hypothetical protein